MSNFAGQGIQTFRITASGNAVVSGNLRFIGINVIGGVAVTTVYRDIVQTDVTKIIAEVTAPTTTPWRLDTEGVECPTGVSVTLGAGATSALIYFKR